MEFASSAWARDFEGGGAASNLEGVMDSSSHQAGGAVEILRAATRSPLRDENQAYAQLSYAIQYGAAATSQRSELENWVYRLAVIYTHQTGLLPGFSNSDNETRFERFVCALPAPSHLQFTRNRLKAAIRRLRFKDDRQFLLDVDALNPDVLRSA